MWLHSFVGGVNGGCSGLLSPAQPTGSIADRSGPHVGVLALGPSPSTACRSGTHLRGPGPPRHRCCGRTRAVKSKAAIGIEPGGQGRGRGTGHPEVVDVVARVPVRRPVCTGHPQRLAAEEFGERLTGRHESHEVASCTGEAHTSVSVDETAHVVRDAERRRRWCHRRRPASGRQTELHELLAKSEVAHRPGGRSVSPGIRRSLAVRHSRIRVEEGGGRMQHGLVPL